MKEFKEELDKSLQELFERILSQSSQEPANHQKKAEEAIKKILDNIEAEARKQLAITLAKQQSQQGRADLFTGLTKDKSDEKDELDR